MSPRTYNSPSRSFAATKTRARIVSAAAAILGTPEGISGFSLQAVAEMAGVTRLTVYNQFGSRRALLEAVFDDMAVRGGLHRIPGIMRGSDPQAVLLEVISIFCDFWSFGSDALGPLHAAGASDPEFGASVRERNERRRRLLSVIVRRMAADRKLRSRVLDELIDVLFALTSFPFFSQLTPRGRSTQAACDLIQGLATDASRRALGVAYACRR
ncbi:MAG TPA: TetR/AcrR family transcriptional regulator [Xanthobacteraceae bacterium]|nr:TetR/AcrR family transcriptional regulator [Xanthobacteraceae bacterium]